MLVYYKGLRIVDAIDHALIGCCGAKLYSDPSRAVLPADFYASDLFRKRVRYVESRGIPWSVLSSRMHLWGASEKCYPWVDGKPYDTSLSELTSEGRRFWSLIVTQQIYVTIPPGSAIEIHAGEMYRQHLIPLLERLEYRVVVPTKGLGIGKQLQWYTQNTKTVVA